MVLNELLSKHMGEEREAKEKQARKQVEQLAPQRALYSTVSSSATIDLKEAPKPPIICDCGDRAGAIGPMIFHCAQCESVIRVSPGLGRIEYFETQFEQLLGCEPIDYEQLIAHGEDGELEPLNPTEY